MGYQVGGKTGTSEDGVNTNKYVTSFIGVAPISDPKVTILVTLYNPTGEGGHQGGAVGAPVAGKVLNEVLPYLELKQDNEKTKQNVENVTYKTVKEAEKIIKEKNLKIKLDKEIASNEKEKVIIKEQSPSAGISINAESTVMAKIQ